MEKIYIIEDDENIRNLLKIALEGFGFEAEGFETAEEGLERIRQECPSMAIFDWMLPGMDGVTAIRQIRQTEGISGLPIMLLTAKEKELDIFAFCVTAEECHFLVLGDSEGKLAEAADAVVKNFAAHYSAHHKGEEVQLVRKNKSRELMDHEELIESCSTILIFCKTVTKALKPVDYSWSTHWEYRKLPPRQRDMVNTGVILKYLDRNRNRALGKFLKLHRSNE